MIIPVPPKNPPERCFSCYADLPSNALLGVLRELDWLKRSCESADISFDAAIEGDKPG